MKKNLFISLLAFVGFFATSCDKRVDADDQSSIKRGKERSEYILLCDTVSKDGVLVCKMREVLYSKSGVKIPWSVGEVVTAPLLEASESSEAPDRAVIFYEDFGGRIRPMKVKLFYFKPSKDDSIKLQTLITNIKQ